MFLRGLSGGVPAACGMPWRPAVDGNRPLPEVVAWKRTLHVALHAAFEGNRRRRAAIHPIHDRLADGVSAQGSAPLLTELPTELFAESLGTMEGASGRAKNASASESFQVGRWMRTRLGLHSPAAPDSIRTGDS